MSFEIELDEGTAGRRRVPFRVFSSDGTSPDTGYSESTILISTNGAAQAVSTNSSSIVSANAGQYYAELTQAEVGTLGSIAIFTDAQAGDFPQHVGNVQVVNNNPMSTLSAISDVTIADGDYSAVTIRVDSSVTIAGVTNVQTQITALNDIDGSGVTLHPGTHSDVTIQGIDNDSVMTIAGVTNVATQITALNDIDGSGVTLHAGTHSDATIQGLSNYANISDVTLHAGVHSDVTIQGLTRINSAVTIAADDYSAVTVRAHSSSTIAGVTNTATLIGALNDIDGSGVTLHAGVHSDATIQGIDNDSVMTIAGTTNTATLIGALNDIDGSEVTLHAGTHSNVTIKGIENYSIMTIAGVTNTATLINALNDIDGSNVTLHVSAQSQVADAFLTRSLAGSAQTDKRSVQNALRALRNRVQVDASVLTIYEEDDSTSAWTASTTTGTDPSNVVHINPL